MNCFVIKNKTLSFAPLERKIMASIHPRGSVEYISRLNKINVLNLIREAGEISRAQIVKESGLSAPTVTRIVESLINNEQLVQQVGIGASSGGRPPVIVRFNGENSYVIGIDWGRTHIFGVLADLNGKSLVEIDVQTAANDGFNDDLKQVIDLIEELLRKSQINKELLKGIGVAAAGFINKETHIIEFSPNFGWSNVDILQPLSTYFRVPVIVDNVSRVMAQGELLYGIGADCKDFIFINVGYGIGAGIILDGRVFSGFSGMAGEMGHSRVVGPDAEGRLCACGKTDCLECYSSGRGISEIALEQRALYPDSLLHSVDKPTAEMIATFAQKGDELSINLFNQAAYFLGLAMASMANMLNPAAIVMGGKVLKAGAFFSERIQSVFQSEVIQQPHHKINVVHSALEDKAAAMGAVSLILNDILNLKA